MLQTKRSGRGHSCTHSVLTQAGWSSYLAGMHSGHCLITANDPEVVQALSQRSGRKVGMAMQRQHTISFYCLRIRAGVLAIVVWPFVESSQVAVGLFDI